MCMKYKFLENIVGKGEIGQNKDLEKIVGKRKNAGN